MCEVVIYAQGKKIGEFEAKELIDEITKQIREVLPGAMVRVDLKGTRNSS